MDAVWSYRRCRRFGSWDCSNACSLRGVCCYQTIPSIDLLLLPGIEIVVVTFSVVNLLELELPLLVVLEPELPLFDVLELVLPLLVVSLLGLAELELPPSLCPLPLCLLPLQKHLILHQTGQEPCRSPSNQMVKQGRVADPGPGGPSQVGQEEEEGVCLCRRIR